MKSSKAKKARSGSGIWVNLKAKTGHCEGSRYYGKTKTGEFVTPLEWCRDWATKGYVMSSSSTCSPCKK